MRIAVFEYKVTTTSPIGSCLLRALQGLCHEHEFTVFAAEFDNPCPERIRFVRVPVPTRPLALLFLLYHLVAPLCYWFHRLRTRSLFHSVLMVESNLSFGDVSYTHFCHRAYLRQHWHAARASGLRGVLRWLDHWLHALLEPWIFRRVQHIVVPSHGLEQELETEYPFTKGKIICIPNPIAEKQTNLSEDFDRAAFRHNLGLAPEDITLAFVSLGHFERKGLPLLLQALAQLQASHLRLLIVGGEPDLVATYRTRVRQLGISERVIFVGMQRDVRPYLWAADGFVLPSLYETFSLVTFEAAAAGLPVICSSVYGVEEFLRDGQNGILIDHTVGGVAQGLSRFLALSPETRQTMGTRAQRDISRYDPKHFVNAWQSFFARLQNDAAHVTSKRKWLVIGHYGGHNTGDDAMLMGLVLAGGPEFGRHIVIVTKDGNVPSFLANTTVRAIRATLRAVVAELLQVQGVVIGGGTHFHDDYVGRRYVRHTRYMLWFAGIALVTKLLRKRVLWLSMGFGPFFRAPTKWITRLGLQFCDYVTVRDTCSYHDISPWVAPQKIDLTFDLAALLPGRDGLKKVGKLRKKPLTLGVSATSVQNSKTGGPLVDAVFWDRFGENLASIFARQQAMNVRLFIIRGGTRDDDKALTCYLYQKLAAVDATRVEIMPYDANPLHTLQKIAECEAFIASRFHSGMLAYLSGCRLLFLAYHRKVEDLAREIGLSTQACIQLCSTVSDEIFSTKISELLSGAETYKPTLPVSEATRRAQMNFDILDKYTDDKSLGLRYAESAFR